jgi:hypothetical protein
MFQDAAYYVMPYVVPLFFFKGPDFCCGTGTIIDPSGLILTANHLVPSDPAFSLFAGRNYSSKAPPEILNTDFEVVKRFDIYDLALIRCPQLPLKDIKAPINFLVDLLSYGHPLGSFGYPQPPSNVDRKIVSGRMKVLTNTVMILRFKSYYVAGVGRPNLNQNSPGPRTVISYELDSFAYGGHSGGPVFDSAGNVVAVMSNTFLHKLGQYEISYCEAVAIKNIATELDSFKTT